MICRADSRVDCRAVYSVGSHVAPPENIRDLRRFVESRLKDLQLFFSAEAVTLRAEISKHVEKITLTPDRRTYIASGTWKVLARQNGWCRGPGVHHASHRISAVFGGVIGGGQATTQHFGTGVSYGASVPCKDMEAKCGGRRKRTDRSADRARLFRGGQRTAVSKTASLVRSLRERNSRLRSIDQL